MKNLLILIIVFAVCSCETFDCGPTKIYEIQVTYINGQYDTLKLSGKCENRFALYQGDLQHLRGVGGNHQIVASGIRTFKVLAIRPPYDSTEIIKTIKLQ